MIENSECRDMPSMELRTKRSMWNRYSVYAQSYQFEATVKNMLHKQMRFRFMVGEGKSCNQPQNPSYVTPQSRRE